MKIFISILIVFLFTTFGFGQKKNEKPDLSGTWQLIESKNFANQNKSKGDEPKKLTLEINYREPELKIVRISSKNSSEKRSEETYYSDERGETNSGYDNQMETTKSKWDGKEFVIARTESVTPEGMKPGVKDIKIKWITKIKLSDDGKTLTFIYDATAPPGIPTRFATGKPKQTYKRVK
ncbi:MAG: hypothetical protein M3367_16105 [Acidobacteriota bacterium]|nr:hypothetical protein [Acidobacteriota bacterium]